MYFNEHDLNEHLQRLEDKIDALTQQVAQLLAQGGGASSQASAARGEDPRMEELYSAVRAGQKIQAIKHARELSGMGLKEAKDFVEEHWDAILAGARPQLPSTSW